MRPTRNKLTSKYSRVCVNSEYYGTLQGLVKVEKLGRGGRLRSGEREMEEEPERTKK